MLYYFSCNLFKISCVWIHREWKREREKIESIHKIFVRPKYLHRRTIYCFDVWCCVGYYAKRLAHIYIHIHWYTHKNIVQLVCMPELLLFTYQKFCWVVQFFYFILLSFVCLFSWWACHDVAGGGGAYSVEKMLTLIKLLHFFLALFLFFIRKSFWYHWFFVPSFSLSSFLFLLFSTT